MVGHSEEYFQKMIENIDISIAEHRLIYDDEGQAVDYEFIYVNDAFCRTLGLPKGSIIGRPVKELLPNLENSWIERYAKVVEHQKPARFVMYTSTLDAYYNVYAYPSGKDCFTATFTNAGSMPPKEQIEQRQTKNPSVAMLEYNRISKHIVTVKNLHNLVGQDIKTYDEYKRFIQENTHPEDFNKITELDRAIKSAGQSEKVFLVRIHHQEKQRYIWVELTVFVKSYSGETPEIITIFGQNKDAEFENIKQKNNMERLFEETKKVANIATFLYDVQTKRFEKPKDLRHFLGMQKVEDIDDFRKIVHANDLEQFDQATDDIISRPEGRVNTYRITKYGDIHHLESYLYGQQDENGQTSKVFGILIDRTDEILQARYTERAKGAFERIFNFSPSGIFAVDEHFEITLKNDKFKLYLENEKIYHHLSDLINYHYELYKEMLLDGKSLENIQIEIKEEHATNYFHVSLIPIEATFENKYLGAVVDITDIVRKTKEVEYLSTHDMLTDLYNRHSFDEMILSMQSENKQGVIVCDIDGLKLMNDAFGHLDGDKLLVRFSEKLKEIIKDGFIARIGGDEFGIILENTTDEELDKVCSDIIFANEDIGLYDVDFSVSIGYSVVHDDQRFFDAFREAENRMYRMKLKQRGNRKSKALQSILAALDNRSIYHKPHREFVAKYAREIMVHAGYKRNRDLDEIEQVGLLHDVGKIVVNEDILQKPRPLNEDEMKMVQYHAESGYKIISNIIDNDMIGISVLYHHENYDGSGYPHGIRGHQIPLYSRVIRIADSYDIMTREDTYKSAMKPKEATEELLSLKGKWYDPELVDAFIEYLKKEGTI